MRDIQPKWNNGSKMALKDAAKQKGLTISKSETMSDWCAEKLRLGQIHYAAMDALALFVLDGGKISDQKKMTSPTIPHYTEEELEEMYGPWNNDSEDELDEIFGF